MRCLSASLRRAPGPCGGKKGAILRPFSDFLQDLTESADWMVDGGGWREVLSVNLSTGWHPCGGWQAAVNRAPTKTVQNSNKVILSTTIYREWPYRGCWLIGPSL